MYCEKSYSALAMLAFFLVASASGLFARAEEPTVAEAPVPVGLFSNLFSLANFDIGNLGIPQTFSSLPILNGILSVGSSIGEPVAQLLQEGAVATGFLPAITGIFGGAGGNARRRLGDKSAEADTSETKNEEVILNFEESFNCQEVNCPISPEHICCQHIPTGLFTDQSNHSNHKYNVYPINSYQQSSMGEGYAGVYVQKARVDCSQQDCRKSPAHMCCWECDRQDCFTDNTNPCCNVKFHVTYDYSGCENHSCAYQPHHACCQSCDRINCSVNANHHCCYNRFNTRNAESFNDENQTDKPLVTQV